MELGQYKKSKVSKKDFGILKVIGRGSYGKVYMVNYIANNQIYAMKSLKKEMLIKTASVEGTKGKPNSVKVWLLCVCVYSWERTSGEARSPIYHEVAFRVPRSSTFVLDHGFRQWWRTFLPPGTCGQVWRSKSTILHCLNTASATVLTWRGHRLSWSEAREYSNW